MTEKERAELIRKGNELYNQGNYTGAEKLFIRTQYQDGLIRIGDYLYYEKRMPLAAYKYYKMGKAEGKIKEIYSRMVFALTKWIREDEKPEGEPIPPKIHPKLMIAAQEILRKQDDPENGL